MDSNEELELTRDMRKKFQRAYGLVELAQEFLDTDVIRELYYADGRLDRVELELVEIKKPVVVNPERPVTPAEPEITTPEAIGESQPEEASDEPVKSVPEAGTDDESDKNL